MIKVQHLSSGSVRSVQSAESRISSIPVSSLLPSDTYTIITSHAAYFVYVSANRKITYYLFFFKDLRESYQHPNSKSSVWWTNNIKLPIRIPKIEGVWGLIKFANNAFSALHSSLVVLGIFIDFSKAFDAIDHYILTKNCVV